MASSYTSLSKLFHWLFDDFNISVIDEQNDVCIFRDAFRLLRVALTCFLFMIIQTLIEESAAQALINHMIQTCAHAVATTIALVPPHVTIIITFSMCFVFLPQIAKLIAPAISRLQQYARKYFPTRIASTASRSDIAPVQLTRGASPVNGNPGLVSPEELNLIKTEISKILSSAMSILLSGDDNLNFTPIKPTPIRGQSNTNKKLKQYILDEVSKQLTASLREAGLTVSSSEITDAVDKAYQHTIMPKHTIEYKPKFIAHSSAYKEQQHHHNDSPIADDNQKQFRVIKKAFADLITRQTPPANIVGTTPNPPQSPTRSFRSTTPRSLANNGSTGNFVCSI